MTKKTRLKRKIDRLIQDKLVKENPKCLVCGKQTSEMHHFVPKSQSLYLRFKKYNLVPLCRSCHFSHHSKGDPTISGEIIKRRGWKWYDKLNEDRRKIFKNTLTNLREVLKEWEGYE